jgi:hypothetical protein
MKGALSGLFFDHVNHLRVQTAAIPLGISLHDLIHRLGNVF